MEMQSSSSGRPVDLHAICRLCLSDRQDSLKSIFDEILGPSRLPQKIELLMQIQISRHDKLSSMVCNDCIIRLDTWFAYKKQCHKNQIKLAEWLNISKTSGHDLNESNFSVKQEPVDPATHGLMPVKVELSYDYEDYNESSVGVYPPDPNDHMYLEDLDIEALETDDDRRCPDCGKMFGSVQNRRRHQNMMHAKKERRAQMMEIGQGNEYIQSHQSSSVNHTRKEEAPTEDMDLEPSDNDYVKSESEKAPAAKVQQENNRASERQKLENGENDSDKSSTPVIESVVSNNKSVDMDTSTDVPIEDPETKKTTNEHKPPPLLAPSSETPAKEEKPNADVKSEKSVDKANEDNSNESKPQPQEDEKKIQFAAGLRLVQKDSTHIEMEPLSKIELSYIEKCKAMVSMFHTLQCACHNVQHKTVRYLLSHLRETRIWFPLFTCYNCMISLTDRSTFTKHHSRCPKPQLETLIKLSNIRKRSDVKPRLYQNFKCNRCKFLFSFHEDFCKHIDEDHAYGSPPFYCSCRYVFDSLDEYKTHCYTSCILSYYCDICFITTPTLEEFVKHSQELHDNSEGFILLQENSYVPRNHTYRHKEADDESNVLEGKRERRKSIKEPIMVQIYDREIPPDLKEIPTRVIKKMIQLDSIPTTADGWNKTPACCPLCKKQYSSVNNMMRHYRTHIERREVEIPKMDDDGTDNEDLYTCPDCGGVYPSSRWKQHLQEKHPTKVCSECDKEFQFQSELDQHRSVHLNIKVFRDSKTQAYRSAIVSPTSENNGLLGEVMVMCEICDAMFKSKEELKTHKLTHHDSSSRSGTSSAMETCEISADEERCSASDDVGDTRSSKGVNDDNSYCDICEREFASPKSFREHLINKHGSEFLKRQEYPKKCTYCDKECTTGAAFALHMQMHDRMNPLDKKGEFPKKCEYCDKICATGAGLYLHTQMHERVTLGDIKKNKKDDKRKSDILKSDVEDDEEEESYHTCKRCFKVFGTKFKLKEHMKCHGINVKKNRKILCDLCHVAVENSEALAKHKSEEHRDELDDMPDLTNEMEVDEDSRGTNNTDSNTGVIYACDICEDTFSSKPELRSHKETHSKPKTKNAGLVCKHCKISFNSVNELTKHMHREHEESAKPKVTKEYRTKSREGSDKPFKCPVCAKGFATHGAMTTHSGWHKRGGINKPAENTPKATAAAKMTRRENMLKKVALASVTKQEPIEPPEFQCSTCLMELPNDTALQIHALEKHGNMDAMMLVPRCNTCNQDFDTQEEYDTHKRFHDFLERQKKNEQQQIQTPVIQNVQTVTESSQGSPKKFPCNWCNSVFSRNDTLNTHIKHHHKEHVKTEFECNECNRIFDKQNSLTIHLKVHQKQKNAAAAAAQSVVQVSTGSSGKVYVCSLCNKGFGFPKDLRMHTINAHPF